MRRYRSRGRSRSRGMSRGRTRSRGKSRGRSRRKSRSRRQMGGGNNVPEPVLAGSATSWGDKLYGSVQQQMDNALKGTGPSNNQVRSNISGGGKRSRSRSRSRRNRKGGFWGEVINQAIVPFTLIGLNQRGSRLMSRKKK